MRAGKRPAARFLGSGRASDAASIEISRRGGSGSVEGEVGTPAGWRSGFREVWGRLIMGHRKGSQMVGALRIKGLLLTLVLFVLAVAACAPPGSDTGGGGGGGGGEEAQQKVEKS